MQFFQQISEAQGDKYFNDFFLITFDSSSSINVKLTPPFSLQTSSDTYFSSNHIKSIYDSDNDYYKPTFDQNITPIINTTSNNCASTSSNEQNEDTSEDSSYNEQDEEIFQKGVDQNRYKNGEFDEDFPKYTENDIEDAGYLGCVY